MENASKALIIAGSILIALVLIGVGMLLINGIGETNREGARRLDQIAISTINARFTPYEGIRKGSDIRGLIGEIATYNLDADETAKISFNGNPCTTTEANDLKNKTGIGMQYTVTFEYETGGLIKNIKTDPVIKK